MAEINVPRTPTPGSKGAKGSSVADVLDHDSKYTSPPPPSSSDFTPPPSTQPAKQTPRMSSNAARLRNALPASPPSTTKPLPATTHLAWSGPIPTVDQARELPEPRLRELVCELIPVLNAARMVAAHAKLQHSLLSLEAAEAAQRAAVEHEMTRREVEVLQAGSPVLRSRASPCPDASSPQAQIQRLLEVAMKRGRQLEGENVHLQRRLKKAKLVIKFAEGKSLQLTEDNELLRLRIKQNREHVDAMRLSGGPQVFHTPRASQNSSSYPKRADLSPETRMESQNPFDALLFAGQVLNGEPASVPSTPTLRRPMKFNAGHIRGTHSLSSLPTTPDRQRILNADRVAYTPLNQAVATSHASFSAPTTQMMARSNALQQDDRESTISASDDEAYTDEDVPASRASQAASSMLRRYAGPNPNLSPTPQQTPRNKLVQTKIMGKLTKPGLNSRDLQERTESMNEADEDGRRIKRARLDQGPEDRLGLGIAVWPNQGR